MNVTELMTTRLVTVGFDDTLAQVRDIFDHAHIHHLLVVDEGKLYGIVSDRDLLRALSPFIDSELESFRDTATLNRRVHQIMSRKPATLPPTADVAEAIRLLTSEPVSCVPVVDNAFRPVGIVTWRDILRTDPRAMAVGV